MPGRGASVAGQPESTKKPVGPMLLPVSTRLELHESSLRCSVKAKRMRASTLEPVLTTPIGREEFLLGKALAALVPSVVVAYAVFAIFLACVELFAHPGVASALIQGPDLLAQLLFTPLLATWSIWVGLGMSTRLSDIRVAQQLGVLASLPPVFVAVLIALNVIHATLGLGAVLLLGDGLGWRITAATFDRERLVTGTRS